MSKGHNNRIDPVSFHFVGISFQFFLFLDSLPITSDSSSQHLDCTTAEALLGYIIDLVP